MNAKVETVLLTAVGIALGVVAGNAALAAIQWIGIDLIPLQPQGSQILRSDLTSGNEEAWNRMNEGRKPTR